MLRKVFIQTNEIEQFLRDKNLMDTDETLDYLDKRYFKIEFYINIANVHGQTYIEDCDLSVRLCNLLHNAGIRTIEKVIKYSSKQLLAIPGFGEITLSELQAVLAQRNLKLAIS
jgi:DNA-directed RNA polymerase alpha subunit